MKRTARAAFGWALAALVAACADPRPTSGAGVAAASGTAQIVAAVDAGAPEAGAADVAAAAPLGAVLTVPRARGPIVPTGHFRIEHWAGAVSTGTLLDRDGRGAVPVSEARWLWGDGMLYLFFYAGDLDLQAHVTKHDGPVANDDSVALAFGAKDASTLRIVRISVTGVVADAECPTDAEDVSDPRCNVNWESGVRAATDYDGKLNDIHDRDEEWAVEAALPLASLGLTAPTAATRVPLRVSRCEIAHDGPRVCGAWAGTLVLGGSAAR